jgi:hypothetical protein
VNGDPVRLDLAVRRRDAQQLAGVHSAADDAADDEIAFGDLQRDLVLPVVATIAAVRNRVCCRLAVIRGDNRERGVTAPRSRAFA